MLFWSLTMKGQNNGVLMTDDSACISNSISMVQKSKLLFQRCKICAAPAFFNNFGIISCSSCKMFFKRNAQLTQEHFTCDFDGHCEISINTRHICGACRLAQCFASGMQIELIRCARSRKNTKKQKKIIVVATVTEDVKIHLQQLPTLNLLRSDQSTLTIHQWNLLSNLIHCYDEYSGLLSAHRFLSEQNALPLKLRFRIGPVGNFLVTVLSGVQRVFEKNGDYLALCTQDHSTLLRNTIKHTSCIGATFVLHQARLLNDFVFYRASEHFFGSWATTITKHIIDYFDSDEIFGKITLSIVAFSTINYTVHTNTDSINVKDIKTIIRIQDTYAELAWQYLVYRYSYKQAVIRLCNLIRCIFHVNYAIVEMDKIQLYRNLIDIVIQQTQKGH